ncbi:MAG: AsmA-like C-terminal domain-containing protein [Parvularculaceae bacterium]
MHRTRSRAARIGLIAFEVVGVLIAVAAASAGLLYWRLQSGPLPLTFFEQSAEFAASRALPRGYSVDIRSMAIARGASAGEYDLTLRKLIISNDKGAAISELSALDFQFFASDLFVGALGPRRVFAEDGVFELERGMLPERRESAAKEKAPLRAFMRSKFLRTAFSSAEIRNARIAYKDPASGRSWVANKASARIDKSAGGLVGRAEGFFDIDGEPASLKVLVDYADDADTFNTTIDVVGAPIGDLLEIARGRSFALLSAPVTGRATFAISQSAKIVSSQIDARIGAGELTVGEKRVPLDYADFHAAFDPAQNLFKIARIEFSADGSHGVLAGDVDIEISKKTKKPSAMRFELQGEEITLDTEGFLPQPLDVNSLQLAGSYDFQSRRFAADSVSADLLGVTIAGGFEFAPGPKSEEAQRASPSVKVQLGVEGVLHREQILAGWPTALGLGARDFITERLPEGRAENVVFKLDMPAGSLKPGEPMPDEAMELSFDVLDATVIYGEGMTPLTHASGTARLTGNRFLISSIQGKVGPVALGKGEIDFTALSPAGEPVFYRFGANGKASDILNILNEEPLAVLKDTGFDSSRFIGDVSVRMEIMRPNLREVAREDYAFAGRATFDDLTVTEIFNGADIDRAAGTLELKSQSMTVSANGELAGSPIKIDWDQAFNRKKGSSKFRVSGEMDTLAGDVLGMSQRGLVRGTVSYSAEAIGSLGAIDTLRATADLQRASLSVDALNFAKLVGEPAKLAIDLAFSKGAIEVRDFALTNDFGAETPVSETEASQPAGAALKKFSPIAIFGTARFGAHGYIENVNLPRVQLGEDSNFAVEASRADSGILELTLTGESIDLSRFIMSAVESGPRSDERGEFGWGVGAVLRGRVNKLHARGDSVYSDASLDLRRGAERMEALDFSARTADGKPLSVVLKETGSEQGPRQVVEARTDDIGALLSSVFDIRSIKGGEGVMEVLVSDKKNGEQGLKGKLEARGVRVVKAPLLARIFSAGSFNGLSDLLNGDGIALSEGSAKFDFSNGVIAIEDARATGPSVGITGQGRIAAGEGGEVSLTGAVAPAYQVNSLLGKAPLIGEILVNREGEGVVALSYSVSGPSDAPTVTVNPLSALAPGFLRRMFEDHEDVTPVEPAPATQESTPPTE